MKYNFGKKGYKSWLTKWYIGFFTIVVIGFTFTIFLYISNQTWDKYNYGISQLGEEMHEELSELRDDLDQNNFDPSVLVADITEDYDLDDIGPVIWTPTLLEEFKSEVEQELIDESIDNHLEDIGYVQISNLISGKMIYQSPEIEKHNIQFIEPRTKLWGYQAFQYETVAGNTINGIGYSGLRITKNYFVGLIPDSDKYLKEKKKYQELVFTIYEIVEAVDRKADSLFVEDKDKLIKMLESVNAWAYVYIYEEDRILWSTKDLKNTDIYIPYDEDDSDIIVIPRETIPKEYFYEIQDDQGRDYRQYTLIDDIIPTFIYRIDLAVPTDSIRQGLTYLAIYFALGALLLIGIVWAGGNVLMRRALRPVDEVIRSVNEITSKNIDKRLPLPKLENEITRLVQTFNKLLDRLAKSFQMQKVFIADASHELRTPLSIIMTDIEIASKNVDDNSQIRKSLGNVVIEIDRMARIVDDLHLLAKSDSGQTTIDKKDIRLDEVLMAAVSRCQVLANKKNISLAIKKIEIIEYAGDEELLIRALSNLVYNAIKYSDENGMVELDLIKKDSLAFLSVSDQGIGIAKGDQLKIFDRFYRVDSSRSRDTGGSGLGLAISKWICGIHSGKIKVISELGQGSTFTIELPLEI